MTLTLLHTAHAHVPIFEGLAQRLAPGTTLNQTVRADWLARAQSGITDDLAAEIALLVQDAPGVVICTCTTIGAAAEAAGAIRIDTPMMDRAAQIGGKIVMAYALRSTETVSRAALDAALTQRGMPAEVQMLFLGEFWPLFEAGEHTAFAACIASALRDTHRNAPADCIVLAQASMAGAAPLLADLGVPVLASPEIALRQVLGL